MKIALPMGRHDRVIIPVALYALAAALLLVRIGEYPVFPYNWESYTAWHFSRFWAGPEPSAADILALSDGLMTDSGRGPLVGVPVRLGFSLDGVGLAALRWPVALVTALAAPLTWALGRRLLGGPAALVAALLLAVSPVFLLYGRTATLVGISLVPALLTMLALARVLDSADSRRAAGWLLGLQGCLIAGAYAYAPVRLLWPLAAVVLLAAAIGWRGRRRFFALAGLATIVIPPAALVGIDWLTIAVWEPWATISGYFSVRGEHLLELRENPENYLTYLRQPPAGTTEPWRLALSLIIQNAGDLLRLLADWQTEPVVTNYWNPRGSLWSWILAPFFGIGVIGLVVAAVRDRSWRARLLLMLLLGLTLPLLLTTRVHVGRLVPALPLLLLAVAWGWAITGDLLARLIVRRWPARPAAVRRAMAAGLASLILLTSSALTLAGYGQLPAETQETRQVAAIRAALEQAAERGGAAVVAPAGFGLEIEAVRAGTYWLALDDAYRIVDLTIPKRPAPDGDRRPPLYVVGVVPRLLDGELPNACDNVYFVHPEAVSEIREAISEPAVQRRCPDGLRFVPLPE